jgi:hypothetical protein
MCQQKNICQIAMVGESNFCLCYFSTKNFCNGKELKLNADESTNTEGGKYFHYNMKIDDICAINYWQTKTPKYNVVIDLL